MTTVKGCSIFVYNKTKNLLQKMITRKITSVVWQIHQTVNVEFENFNNLHNKINRKISYTPISVQIRRLKDRYNQLTTGEGN